MLNLLFNTLLTIIPHNTQKRRRRKERTTHGPLRRYSRWVTHPVRNPDRQGLTWAPELKLNFSGRHSFFGEIFSLEYPSRRNEKVNCHFVNYRLSFRKLQILISQITESVVCEMRICSLCYLLGKTYKSAHSSATLESLKSTRSTKLLEKLLTWAAHTFHWRLR